MTDVDNNAVLSVVKVAIMSSGNGLSLSTKRSRTMTKREQAEQAMRDIRRNTEPGLHTMAMCSVCGRYPARGGERCIHCATHDLAKMIGDDLADQFTACSKIYRGLMTEINNKLESLDD